MLYLDLQLANGAGSGPENPENHADPCVSGSAAVRIATVSSVVSASWAMDVGQWELTRR